MDGRERTVLSRGSKSSLRDDRTVDNGVLFWVNKSGFPIDPPTWERMWTHVEKIHPQGTELVKSIQRAPVKHVPMPQVPVNFPKSTTIPGRINAIQSYMRQLQYNHTGTQFFEIRKNRPLCGLNDVARVMIRESLPIKCLEAVILGIHLTNGMPGVERFPISFKSKFCGNVHRHVVLGIFHAGKFGAIGMSRREDLMYKPIAFKTLSELVFAFHDCYHKYWHTVKKTKIGLPVAHEAHSFEQIAWKTLQLNVPTLTQHEMTKDIERHSKEIRSLARMKQLFSGPGLKKTKTTISINVPARKASMPLSPTKKRSSIHAEKGLLELRRSKSGQSPDVRAQLDDYQIRI